MKYTPNQVTVLARPIKDWKGPQRCRHETCRFKAGYMQTERLLKEELGRIGVHTAILQLDIDDSDLRVSGELRANASPRSSKVAISFQHPQKGDIAWPCWTYSNWKDNVRAIAKSLEAIRAVERFGATEVGQLYTGFRALPGGESEPIVTAPSKDDDARELLRLAGYDIDEGLVEVILSSASFRTSVYRQASAKNHPDKLGGDESVQVQINAIYARLEQA